MSHFHLFVIFTVTCTALAEQGDNCTFADKMDTRHQCFWTGEFSVDSVWTGQKNKGWSGWTADGSLVDTAVVGFRCGSESCRFVNMYICDKRVVDQKSTVGWVKYDPTDCGHFPVQGDGTTASCPRDYVLADLHLMPNDDDREIWCCRLTKEHQWSKDVGAKRFTEWTSPTQPEAVFCDDDELAIGHYRSTDSSWQENRLYCVKIVPNDD